MSVIAEAALSAFWGHLFDKFTSLAQNFVAELREVPEQLKKWQSKLSCIQAVLNDAEEKQIKAPHVKNWLADLQDLAYDVDDILDEFAYEVLRLNLLNREAEARPSNKRKRPPTSFTFDRMMMSKIEQINTRLDDLTTIKNSLGLSEMSEGASSKEKKPRLQPTSLMDEAMAYVGREQEKRKILELLESNNSGREAGVSVISIVGMGGMGKTTLAQLVYNGASKEDFPHKAWVCVSDDFDVYKITKIILKSVTSESCDDDDLNLLQTKLKEKLSGKKFLLVLDDIWNVSCNEWTILLSPFGAGTGTKTGAGTGTETGAGTGTESGAGTGTESGAGTGTETEAGTKIIVTTRFENVSSNVDAVQTFHLDKLSHGDCLSIFTQYALKSRDFNDHPVLKEVGEKIVKKCSGLPLAAKVIGRLLRTTKNHDSWEKISKSEIWELREDPEDPSGIIPALRLSYHYLPPLLKSCFAYCSIFPKGYEFEEEEIILLWRAEGLLKQNDFGNQSFRDLVSRSFFQISSNDRSRFVMHDLINDLAQSVAGEICSKLKGDKQLKFSNRTRHLSYVCNQYDGKKKFEAFYPVKCLRTFLPLKGGSCFLTNFVLDKLLRELKCLRVLSLNGYQIFELPNFLEDLKHLRYLDFSNTGIKCLPDSLCTLYHLETLILRECKQLETLPSKIGNLMELQYLDISGAIAVKEMPLEIGKLTNLQRLSNFVLGEGNGDHIQRLKNLSNLRGDFCLSGLKNVEGKHAPEAKLNEKSGIDTLRLQWSTDFGNDTRNIEDEERVLDFLRPQNKLEQLIIENYGGAEFSAWIVDSSFKNLLSLKLRSCKNCKSLPSIGRLPQLKDLLISDFNEVKEVGAEFFGNQPNAFSSLETLHFKSLSNWKEWNHCEGNEQVLEFPKLRELNIKNCPKLSGRLPTRLHSLQKLQIYNCTKLVVSISSFPSLCELKINGCEKLEDECFSKVASLQSVSLSNILSSLPERIMSRLTNLGYFEIDGWKELSSLSQGGLGFLGHLSSLREIQIRNCPRLVSLETEEVDEKKLQLGKTSDLESLSINNCASLKRLPEVLNVKEMRISNCPGLTSFAKNNLPPTLKILKIRNCENLKNLVGEEENKSTSYTCSPERLEISWCDSLQCLSGYVTNGLRLLNIYSCPMLTSVFFDVKFPMTLKQLEIRYCPKLECIAEDFHETTGLESIKLFRCDKIKSLPRGLEKLSHLQEITIEGCPSMVSSEESGLPPATNLRVFSINDCGNFGALPKCMSNFTSLRELSLLNCSADISIPEKGFPTNLTLLEFSKAPKFYDSLVKWGLDRLTSLQRLDINGEGCSNVVSFPEGKGMMLPPSLIHIDIRKFENLKYMFSEGFQNLNSLQYLSIVSCSKLTTLPEKDMLLSLGCLRISGCPLLEKNCKRDEGREWDKIAHIPSVDIDKEKINPRGHPRKIRS